MVRRGGMGGGLERWEENKTPRRGWRRGQNWDFDVWQWRWGGEEVCRQEQIMYLRVIRGEGSQQQLHQRYAKGAQSSVVIRWETHTHRVRRILHTLKPRQRWEAAPCKEWRPYHQRAAKKLPPPPPPPSRLSTNDTPSPPLRTRPLFYEPNPSSTNPTPSPTNPTPLPYEPPSPLPTPPPRLRTSPPPLRTPPPPPRTTLSSANPTPPLQTPPPPLWTPSPPLRPPFRPPTTPPPPPVSSPGLHIPSFPADPHGRRVAGSTETARRHLLAATRLRKHWPHYTGTVCVRYNPHAGWHASWVFPVSVRRVRFAVRFSFPWCWFTTRGYRC